MGKEETLRQYELKLRKRVEEEEAWMERCGGGTISHAAYISRYSECGVPREQIDAIWKADFNVLNAHRAELEAWLLKRGRRLLV